MRRALFRARWLRPSRELEPLNPSRIENETGHVMIGVPCKPDRPDLAAKHVLRSRAQRIGLALQPHQRELAILDSEAVHRLNLIAHKGARVLNQLRGSWIDGNDRLVDLGMVSIK